MAEAVAQTRRRRDGRDSRTENERFLEGFLLPLIRGGEVHVGRPLGAKAVDALVAEAVMPGDGILEVEQARRLQAAGLWLYPVPLAWDRTMVRLAVAAHNLLFLDHPDAARWTATSGRLRRLERFTSDLLELPAPRDGAEAVARHTVVGGLFGLQREDVVVDTWLMIYSFRGQEPPAGLRRFPSLRRVHEQRSRVKWIADEQLSDAQLELVGKLLRASPLTDLLTPLRPRPAFAWDRLAAYLRWRLLARLVCQRYLELGLEQVGPPLCGAFWELVAQPATPALEQAVRRVLGLLIHLCASASLREQDGNPGLDGGADPLERLTTVLAVALESGLLPTTLMERPLQLRLEKIAAERAQALGPQTTNELVARLRAALR